MCQYLSDFSIRLQSNFLRLWLNFVLTRTRACMKVSCESRPRIRSDRPILVKQQPISPISTGRQWARHKAWTESHIICSPPKTENCTNLNFCRHLSRARQYFMHDRIYLQIRGYPSLPIISQS